MDTALNLLKDRLGLRSSVRDILLTAILQGIETELRDEKGLALDMANPHHLMFVVDLAVWRYQSTTDSSVSGSARIPSSMPRHLQFRLHNLMLSAGGGTT